MDTSTAILHIAMLLIGARILGEFAACFQVPSVIVVAYTTLLTLFWLRLFYKRYGDRIDSEL